MNAASPHAAIARAALRHGGHVSHAQLRLLGLSREAIRHRVGSGLLIPVHRGVYAIGHLPTTPVERAHGALLACGPGAALSHDAAAALWEIADRWPDKLHVVVPGNRRRSGLVIHRAPALRPIDFLICAGLRSTSRARTLLDYAPSLSEDRLLRAVNHQRAEFRLKLDLLLDVLARFPRHPGARRLRAILAGAPEEYFRSGWEVEWPPYAVAHGLPRYVMNLVICGVRVDVFFPVERLIVELDGWSTHGTRAAFETDRERRNEILAETGIPTVAITYEQFHRHGARQAARLHKILARRRRELGRAG